MKTITNMHGPSPTDRPSKTTYTGNDSKPSQPASLSRHFLTVPADYKPHLHGLSGTHAAYLSSEQQNISMTSLISRKRQIERYYSERESDSVQNNLAPLHCKVVTWQVQHDKVQLTQGFSACQFC
jgi:hypothetical protein